jgi:hypothetical protein
MEPARSVSEKGGTLLVGRLRRRYFLGFLRGAPRAPSQLGVRQALLGRTPSCDSQVSTKDNRPVADVREQSTVAPTRTGYANVNGARFYYQIYGDLTSEQTPLLVLHGSYMSSDAMAPLSRP